MGLVGMWVDLVGYKKEIEFHNVK